MVVSVSSSACLIQNKRIDFHEICYWGSTQNIPTATLYLKINERTKIWKNTLVYFSFHNHRPTPHPFCLQAQSICAQ